MRSIPRISRARVGLAAAVAAAGAVSFGALGNAASNQAQPPQNTAAPTIAGTAQSGQQLTANPGTWTGDAPIVFSFAWLRCNPAGNNCVAIPEATGQTYTAGAADVGNTLRVRVTATNAAGSNEATSAATDRVAEAPPPPQPGSTIPVTAVTAPERLVASQVRFEPNIVSSRTAPLTVRVRVLDTRGFVVSGALVFVRSTPLVTTSAGEATTGADGWATVVLQPRGNMRIVAGQDNLQIFVRVRKPDDPLLAGVSGRRLVQVPIARGL